MSANENNKGKVEILADLMEQLPNGDYKSWFRDPRVLLDDVPDGSMPAATRPVTFKRIVHMDLTWKPFSVATQLINYFGLMQHLKLDFTPLPDRQSVQGEISYWVPAKEDLDDGYMAESDSSSGLHARPPSRRSAWSTSIKSIKGKPASTRSDDGDTLGPPSPKSNSGEGGSVQIDDQTSGRAKRRKLDDSFTEPSE